MTNPGELKPAGPVSMSVAEHTVTASTGEYVGRATLRAADTKPASIPQTLEDHVDVWETGGVSARNIIGEYTL
jgi:hypothetical protein